MFLVMMMKMMEKKYFLVASSRESTRNKSKGNEKNKNYKECVKTLPIDPEFMKNYKVTGEHNGHKVRGEVKPPKKLGIHGTQVAVDHDVCNGDEVCVSVCPVSVFEMVDSHGHPTSEKKSDPKNEPDCIFCRACEVSCPTQAIKITEQ